MPVTATLVETDTRVTFPVSHYVYNVGYKNSAVWDGTKILIQGYVACYGADNWRFIVYGLHPDSPVPPKPVYNIAGRVGAIFVPFCDLQNYVDIVRNERPVYAFLAADHPEWMCLKTSAEPVGEGEYL